jgi:hypothetical protein
MSVMPHRYNKVGTVYLSIVMCTKVDPNDVFSLLFVHI